MMEQGGLNVKRKTGRGFRGMVWDRMNRIYGMKRGSMNFRSLRVRRLSGTGKMSGSRICGC
jgi:hypothetical protein